MNAINRDKTRKIVDEIAGISEGAGAFASAVKFNASHLLLALANRDGADVREVGHVIHSLQVAIHDEQDRRDEAAELAAELAAVEARKQS